SDKIALGDLSNEHVNFYINCDSGITQQKSGVLSHVKLVGRISSENVFQNVSTPRNYPFECWLCNEMHFAQLRLDKSYKLSGN
ncbi:unnamed protein product, partial [Hymenolepis diminuta]